MRRAAWRLARRLAERLPRRPRLVDLGAGTGSMFRFLAPIIGRGQDWMLVDADAALLDEAFGRTAAWARRQGFAATAPAMNCCCRRRMGLWRMRVLDTPLPLAGEVAAQARRVRVYVMGGTLTRRCAPTSPAGGRGRCGRVHRAARSGLRGVAGTAVRHADACRSSPVSPSMAAMSGDRGIRYDALVRAAFRRDMRRDKGFGPALGTAAPRVLSPRAAW